MAMLTEYEQQQVREIAGWKAEPPALIVEVMDALSHPLAKLAERFIPTQLVKDAIKIAYGNSEILAHRELVAERAGVRDVRELRHADLTHCDELAQHFAREAARRAAIRGTTAGGGAVLSMEISTMFALKTAHTIGFCYGFTPEDPREKHFVLQTLMVASAASLDEKQKAVISLHSIEDEMVEETVENMLENQLEELVSRIVEEAAGSSIPLAGFVTQCVTDAAVTYHTGEVARRIFQERWLRANGKVKRIDPDPALARMRWQRIESILASCFYWPTYFAAFATTFPALLLAELLPRDNAVMQGLADGAAAASKDLSKLKARLRSQATGREAAAVQPQISVVPSPAN